MTPYLDDGDVVLHLGDCIEVMAALPEASVDAVVTDPPYGLGFMGKAWDADFAPADMPMRRNAAQDSVNAGAARQGGRQRAGLDYQRRMARDSREFQAWCEVWAREALRVLKPGGHALVFGGTRTFHRMTCGLEDAGFEIRDVLSWLYGSGFPKNLDVSKAIDKAAGAEREVVGEGPNASRRPRPGNGATMHMPDGDPITAPATPEAAAWQRWGTALKPGWEPIVLARKPLAGTVAANVLEHGTGAINVDGCRIGDGADKDDERWYSWERGNSILAPSGGMNTPGRVAPRPTAPAGRWPANVVLDEEAAARLDGEVGDRPGGGGMKAPAGMGYGGGEAVRSRPPMGDTGGPSRFFYTAKASTSERDGATHPTVKPLTLMRWCVRLVTPTGGVVLDPFAGSGTTLLAARQEGMRAVGVEREEEYAAMCAHRLRQLSLFGGADE